MRVVCIQMDHLSLDPEKNANIVSEQIARTVAAEKPDVITLPELWNTGYFPGEDLDSSSDVNGERTKQLLGGLAKEHSVNIVGGSVSDRRDGALYNTTYVFDREGACVFRYDKIHLLSRSGENRLYCPGNTFGSFLLDGVCCTAVICYDLRFPELCRKVAEPPTEVMFVSSQWPQSRAEQFTVLVKARAIENGIFVVANTSAPPGREGQNSGGSAIVAPRGDMLAFAYSGKEFISADLDISDVEKEQRRRPIWTDRRPELFR